MKYTRLLFDLDGTIIDPREGITASVRYALAGMGITVSDPGELLAYIGPPLRVSFRRYHGLSQQEAETATALYRERFSVSGIFENTLYEGVEEMLRGLASSGAMLYVATSKPTVYARRIIEHYGMQDVFRFIGGSEFNGVRDNKADVIRYVMEMNGIDDAASAVMIGDREHDIIGAKKTGIDSVGVLYGYGSREELETAGADHIAKDIPALYEYLQG